MASSSEEKRLFKWGGFVIFEKGSRIKGFFKTGFTTETQRAQRT
jgi:hypothetical protein